MKINVVVKTKCKNEGVEELPDALQEPPAYLKVPGGWNRIQIEVEDLEATVEKLQAAGAQFRNEIVWEGTSVSGTGEYAPDSETEQEGQDLALENLVGRLGHRGEAYVGTAELDVGDARPDRGELEDDPVGAGAGFASSACGGGSHSGVYTAERRCTRSPVCSITLRSCSLLASRSALRNAFAIFTSVCRSGLATRPANVSSSRRWSCDRRVRRERSASIACSTRTQVRMSWSDRQVGSEIEGSGCMRYYGPN